VVFRSIPLIAELLCFLYGLTSFIIFLSSYNNFSLFLKVKVEIGGTKRLLS
jgi:hypothetical protein